MLTNCLGIVSLTENDSKLKSLTATRPLGAIPIFGRYRAIDFALSNLVNAGVTNVGILAPTKSRSLIDHVGTGKPWDLNRKVGGLYIFNYSYDPPSISDIKLLKSNMEFLLRSRKEMVIFTLSHMICNIDFEEVAKYHEETNADITVVYKKVSNEDDLFLDAPTLILDQDSKVVGVGKNIGRRILVNISLDMFLLSKEFLIECILGCLENGNCGSFRDFVYKNVQNMNVNAYEFKGYVGCINSISSYFKVSMDMLNVDIQSELFSKERPIYTKSNDSPPTRYFSTCDVENSFISNGCLIKGKVKNSIISRGVVIEKDAVVENSIIFSKCIIKSGAVLKNVILDKNVVIDSNATLIGHNKNPLVMEKQSKVDFSVLKEVKKTMNVLFAVSEAFPFAKTGGLADVAYSLPKALRKLGVDIRVIMPKYGDIPSDYTTKMKHLCHFTVPVGWRNQYCGIEYLNFEGVPFYFIDNEYYFKRPGYYGYYDDGERFSYFSRAVCEAIYHLDFDVDIIHVNDWHTSVIPVLLKAHYSHSPKHQKIKTVLTIHNLRYQGVFPKEVMYDLLSLPDEYFDENKLKFYDAISFLKGGIIFADKVVTVSKTYANEIRTLSHGEGLHGLLSGIGEKLVGIVNGIDYEVCNPATDKLIFVNYDANTFESRKKENKFRLQQMLNLPVSDDIVLIGMVSRLTKEKGIDLIERILSRLLTLPVQLVILGAGDYHYEQMFKYYAIAYPSKVSANICYSEELARKIYAGSDIYLMPSLTEPCGISQLIAMRYGTVPIVRETGGLKDTVKPYNQFTGEGWGFSFANYDPAELFAIIKYALSIYSDKAQWRSIVHQAMTRDNSWNASAGEYNRVYEQLLK